MEQQPMQIDSEEQVLELGDLIVQEIEMGFFEKYLGVDGEFQNCSSDGCSRVSRCSCNCNDCPALIM